jgi:mannitol/fructose-specific phosphotransferase system IIA component (Ntr-type)
MRSLLNALQDGRLVELPDSDKDKSLRYLAHLIEAIPELGGHLNLDEEILNREHLANTGIGLGVACPHVRGNLTGDLLSAVGWSPAGIDYGARDGQKVHLLVMYYIPESQKATYLKEISSLAAAIKKENGIQSISGAEDIATVRNRLLDWVSGAIDSGIPESKARMVRLEAREAAAAAGAAPAGIQIVPVLIVALDKPLVLCPNLEVRSLLEQDASYLSSLRTQSPFDRGGYNFIYRAVTIYDPARPLYEYIAIRLGTNGHSTPVLPPAAPAN